MGIRIGNHVELLINLIRNILELKMAFSYNLFFGHSLIFGYSLFNEQWKKMRRKFEEIYCEITCKVVL